MDLYWIESVKEFQEISHTWDELVLKQSSPNPFLLSDFILTWNRHYQNTHKLKIFVVFENGKLIFGLPLCLDRKERLIYPGGIAANYTEPLVTSKVKVFFDIFIKFLIEDKNWRSFHLDRSRYDFDLTAKVSCLVQKYISDYTYLITIPQSPLEFKPSKKLQYYVRRGLHEFKNLGSLEFVSESNSENFHEIYKRYVELCHQVFLEKIQRSAFDDPTYQNYFQDLLLQFCKVGRLDMNYIKLNQAVIAIHFGYNVGLDLNYVLTTYDPKYSKFNPGHLLIFYLCQLAQKRQQAHIDLFTGEHYYKRQWSDKKLPIWRLSIYPKIARNYFYAPLNHYRHTYFMRQKISKLRSKCAKIYLRAHKVF